MARVGTMLDVTVLHGSAADLVWQQRQTLTEMHNCLSLRLNLAACVRGSGAAELQWHRLVWFRNAVRRRRR